MNDTALSHRATKNALTEVIQEVALCGLSRKALIFLLNKRFSQIDYKQAKEDVVPFIKDKNKLDIWSVEFFTEITKGLNAGAY